MFPSKEHLDGAEKRKIPPFQGKEYELLEIATHSETLEQMVVYRALYGERGIWVRPASMWSETVEKDGYSGPRFQYIGDE